MNLVVFLVRDYVIPVGKAGVQLIDLFPALGDLAVVLLLLPLIILLDTLAFFFDLRLLCRRVRFGILRLGLVTLRLLTLRLLTFRLLALRLLTFGLFGVGFLGRFLQFRFLYRAGVELYHHKQVTIGPRRRRIILISIRLFGLFAFGRFLLRFVGSRRAGDLTETEHVADAVLQQDADLAFVGEQVVESFAGIGRILYRYQVESPAHQRIPRWFIDLDVAALQIGAQPLRLSGYVDDFQVAHGRPHGVEFGLVEFFVFSHALVDPTLLLEDLVDSQTPFVVGRIVVCQGHLAARHLSPGKDVDRVVLDFNLFDIPIAQLEQIFLDPVLELGGQLPRIQRHRINRILPRPADKTQIVLVGDRFADYQRQQLFAALVAHDHSRPHALASTQIGGRGVNHSKLLVQSLHVVLLGAFSRAGRNFQHLQVHQTAGYVGYSVLGVGRIVGVRRNAPQPVDLAYLEGGGGARIIVVLDDLQVHRLLCLRKIGEEEFADQVFDRHVADLGAAREPGDQR